MPGIKNCLGSEFAILKARLVDEMLSGYRFPQKSRKISNRDEICSRTKPVDLVLGGKLPLAEFCGNPYNIYNFYRTVFASRGFFSNVYLTDLSSARYTVYQKLSQAFAKVCQNTSSEFLRLWQCCFNLLEPKPPLPLVSLKFMSILGIKWDPLVVHGFGNWEEKLTQPTTHSPSDATQAIVALQCYIRALLILIVRFAMYTKMAGKKDKFRVGESFQKDFGKA